MHKLVFALPIMMGLAFAAGAAHAQSYHYVNPYTRSDGTYVQPHFQTNPNGNPLDN